MGLLTVINCSFGPVEVHVSGDGQLLLRPKPARLTLPMPARR